MMSHELRTPMHAVLSYASLGKEKLLKGTGAPEKLLKYFSRIHNSGQRLLDLINELLDLAKLEAGKMVFTMEEYNLQALIDAVVSDYQPLLNEKGLSLEMNTKNSTKGQFDPGKIEQVIRNFLSNAIKFSPKQTTITICVTLNTLTDSDGDQPAFLFSVRDQGPGIPPQDHEHVFEQFAQSSQTSSEISGTGLGLAICKEIILAHSGKIWVENHPEQGAIFSFLIPQISTNPTEATSS